MKIEPLLVEKPWGGDWLAHRYHGSGKIGEAWLLSTLAEGESKADGVPLSKALGSQLSFVVKIIDAQDNLSVQVHPNDEFARQLENSKGKTECWLILDAKEGAGVYLGLRDGISGEQFADTLTQGRSVKDLIEFYPVKRGDFIVVPAGTIHAIGAGVTLLEVQQASGITYRLWDWDRPGRELHISKGLTVSSFDRRFEFRPQALATAPAHLLKHRDFDVRVDESSGEGWFIDLATYEVYRASESHSAHYIFVR